MWFWVEFLVRVRIPHYPCGCDLKWIEQVTCIQWNGIILDWFGVISGGVVWSKTWCAQVKESTGAEPTELVEQAEHAEWLV